MKLEKACIIGCFFCKNVDLRSDIHYFSIRDQTNMNPPFNLEELLELLARYNSSLFPAIIVAYVAGILAIFFSRFSNPKSLNAVLAILSIMWLFTGLVFLIFYFRKVCPAAYYYAIFYIIQSFLFVLATESKKKIVAPVYDFRSIIGFIFILYAMIGYPVVGEILGHTYPASSPFGIAPWSLTVFTFGIFLQLKRFPKYLLIIPCIWSIGGAIPIFLGMYEDVVMPFAGIICTVLVLTRKEEKFITDTK